MTPPVNLLIPMAGQGKRFREAGYDTYKPFLEIFGKPMIQYVLDAFPESVVKHIVTDRSLLTNAQLAYLTDQANVVVHFIAPHTLGPAYSILQAQDALPLDEAFFVAYCDIFWTWDYSEVQRLLHHDGVVFTRRQFHPHLIGNNYSAFCRTVDGNPGALAEIREKGSFTENWMSEPLSVGTFYVRDGRAMMQAIATVVESDRRVSGEFFPSVIFNDLIAAGNEIVLHDVDFFVHWGVPSQLEDLRSWVEVCRRIDGVQAPREAENVCCMGGAGARMRDMSTVPKAMMPMPDGTPMFEYVATRFACRRTRYVVNQDMHAQLRSRGLPPEQLVDIGAPTTSQLATLMQASALLTGQQDFYLTSCDAFGFWKSDDFRVYLERVRPAAVIFTFEPSLLQQNLGGSHTYVDVDDDLVTAVHIKNKPHDAAAGLAGFFCFRDGAPFADLAAIPDDPGRELCADHVLKQLVETGQRVGAYALDAYVHLGSPDELKEFAFWSGYHQVFPAG